MDFFGNLVHRAAVTGLDVLAGNWLGAAMTRSRNNETAAILRQHNPGLLTEAQALEAASQIGGNTMVNKDGDMVLKIDGRDFVMGLDLILKEARPADGRPSA